MVSANTELTYNSKIEGDVIVSRADAAINWIRSQLDVADADGPGLLRHRADGGRAPAASTSPASGPR